MTERPVDVAVVIPTLHGGGSLLECVDALAPEDQLLDVIIFDNGSVVESTDRVTQKHSSVRVVRSESNLGFATACNLGAAETEAPFVLFLNDDARVRPGDVSRLVAFAQSDQHSAFWQPMILSESGAVENAGVRFSWSGFFRRIEERPDPNARPYPSFAATGTCLLVRRDVFNDVGGFNDEYFAYLEDIDLCWRGRLAGWEVRIVPAIEVRHRQNTTTRRVFAADEVRYMNVRNRIRTIIANASPWSLVRILPMHIAACLVTALLLVSTGRVRSARAVLRGAFWPVGHRREWTAQRRSAQELRCRADSDVLRHDLRAPVSIVDGLAMLRGHSRAWEGP